jgi:hypothetical protein
MRNNKVKSRRQNLWKIIKQKRLDYSVRVENPTLELIEASASVSVFSVLIIWPLISPSGCPAVRMFTYVNLYNLKLNTQSILVKFKLDKLKMGILILCAGMLAASVWLL